MNALRPAAIILAAALVLAGCGGEPATPGAPTATATASTARASQPPDPSAAARDAAFGAWRRAPIRPTPEFAAAVETACRAEPPVGALPLAVLDARGEGRATLVFDDGATAVVCRADVGADGSAAVVARETDRAPDATPPPDRALGTYDLELVDGETGSYTLLVGQVGGGVHDVAVNFDADAAWSTAAMSNGWYAIWWPGAAPAIGVAASDSRNVVITSFTP
ncbi:MAG: hypothetical protein AB1627_04420 [Chloroflexota bacterium]